MMVRSLCGGRMGGLLISLTTTVKLFVVLSGGRPLSVTTVVIVLVLGPCASDGVQLITPFVLMVAPRSEERRVGIEGSARWWASLAEMSISDRLNLGSVR